jgi:hypothetical protein
MHKRRHSPPELVSRLARQTWTPHFVGIEQETVKTASFWYLLFALSFFRISLARRMAREVPLLLAHVCSYCEDSCSDEPTTYYVRILRSLHMFIRRTVRYYARRQDPSGCFRATPLQLRTCTPYISTAGDTGMQMYCTSTRYDQLRSNDALVKACAFPAGASDGSYLPCCRLLRDWGRGMPWFMGTTHNGCSSAKLYGGILRTSYLF